MIFLGKKFKGQADTSATITAVITSIKQSVEDQFRNNIPVETWGNEWSYKDGNDVFTINVDSLADLEVRIKEKKDPPVHTPEQGIPRHPSRQKSPQRVSSYRKRTEKGVTRVNSHRRNDKRSVKKQDLVAPYIQRYDQLKEVQNWTYDVQMRQEADDMAEEIGIEGGIDAGIRPFE